MTEDLLQDFEPIEHFSDKELFTKIWMNPRPVFKYLTHIRHEKYITKLLILAGIANAIEKATLRNSGDKSSLITVLLGAIVGGALFGWLSYFLYSSLVRWTGKWLKGNASTDDILRVLAFATIPNIVGILFTIVEISFFGNSVFKSQIGLLQNDTLHIALGYSLGFIGLVLGIWSLVLSVIGISEVQQFSIAKSIVNLMLPILVIFIPLMLLVLVFTGFR